MPLLPEDIEAQRQYASDTGADLDSLKTFTKEHIDVLRYRGTPLEEEKTKLASEREMSEQRSSAASSKKRMRYTLPVRAPMPSIPVRGIDTSVKTTSTTDRKLDDVIEAVKGIQTEKAPESTGVSKPKELVEPIAEPIAVNELPAPSNPEDNNVPTSTLPLKPDLIPPSTINTQISEQPISQQQSQEPTTDSIVPAPISTPIPEETQPIITPPTSQPTLITNNTNTLAPSPAIAPASLAPINNDVQNITAVLEATTPKPPEFGEERNIDGTIPASSIQSSLPGASPEISSKTAILPGTESKSSIEDGNSVEKNKNIVTDKNDIMAQEREVATQAEEKNIKDSIIEKEKKLANEDIINEEKKISAQVEEKNIKDSIIEKEKKLANEDIINEERENAAAQAREEQVVEGAGIENITKQLNSVRELFGSFAAKPTETNGLDIKSAVTLVRPIADTLVSINNSVLTILNRLAELPGQGGTSSPVLNNSMGIPPNTTTINDGAITMARETFRSTGPRMV